MNHNSYYDYIIIGGGPSGLTLAHILPKDKKILIIEKNTTIGGCHRVDRVNGLFTEHGPRIYSTAYVNFERILKDFNLSLDKCFVNYNFNISNIGLNSGPNFSSSENIKFIIGFFYFMINYNYGNDISMDDFSKDFSKESRDYIDRLCRLTDGAGFERYSLNKFFNLINDQSFNTILMLKEPMDIGIMPKWEEYLIKKGIAILKDCEIVTFNTSNDKVTSVIDSNNKEYIGKQFILAMPPKEISNLIGKSIKNAFGNYNDYRSLADYTNYIDYIPITFHYSTKLKLPKVYGFPKSDWALAFIVVSDYWENSNNTVISTAITRTNSISSNSKKTANNSTISEIIDEVFIQLKLSFPMLPDADNTTVSPTIIRIGNEWKTTDTAYISSPGSSKFPVKSPIYSNLYNVGTQNGHEKYNFTSLESAVSNALALGNILETSKHHTIYAPLTVRKVFSVVIIIIIALYSLNKF